MKRLNPLAIGAAALLLAPLYAASSAAPPPIYGPPTAALQEDDLAGEVEDIIDEYDEAMAAFYKAYEAADTDEARNEVYSSGYPNPAEYGERLMAVVDKAPAHEASLTAIVWMMQNVRSDENKADFLAVLLEHHSESDKIGGVCGSLSRDTSEDSEAFLRKLLAVTKSHDVTGQASYALAGVLGSRLSLNQTISKLSGEDLERYVGYYGEEAMEFCKNIDVEAVSAERKALLVKVRDEFGDVATRRGTLGKSAGAELFEMERLQIGMVAPEIQGDDLDGIDFKLSDYRGQVVFLDFWGDW